MFELNDTEIGEVKVFTRWLANGRCNIKLATGKNSIGNDITKGYYSNMLAIPRYKNSLVLAKMDVLKPPYQTHRFRGTGIAELSAAGYTDSHILQLTGHANVKSLKIYCRKKTGRNLENIF